MAGQNWRDGFAAFVPSIFQHWILLMSGSLTIGFVAYASWVLLGGNLSVGRPLARNAVPWVLCTVAGVCLFIAFFMACLQHRSAEAPQRKIDEIAAVPVAAVEAVQDAVAQHIDPKMNALRQYAEEWIVAYEKIAQEWDAIGQEEGIRKCRSITQEANLFLNENFAGLVSLFDHGVAAAQPKDRLAIRIKNLRSLLGDG